MASDYKRIAEEHEKRYGWDVKHLRIYKKLYSEKTHFVYELIQNADDSGSEYLKLQLDSNALLVWNDGRQFDERDVRSICSLGSSDKDLTDIGTFGIGFKAVYNYTEFPEIYSADECFRIRDCVKPEDIDEMNPEIAELVNRGKTVFRLPFKDNPHHDNDIEHLKNRLCDLLRERSLLFLRCLKTFEWKDEPNDQGGSYSSYRGPFDKIQNVPENQSVELVKLTMSLDDNNESSETLLVFCKEVLPPKNVISRLLEQAEDDEEEQRIQKSEEELQPIEVAFKLQDDRITAIDDSCVLFAYLPTEKVTNLKFLIQARYQTTPPRDNIIKPSDSLWNRWLLEKTADFFPEVLEHLKASGLLEPAFFNILPLKKDKVPKEFEFITEALQKAMREKAFIPTEKEGHYAKAEDVFYPDTISLQKLVKSSGMLSDSELLHPDIRKDTKEFGRCFDIMDEAGVTEIDENDLLCWLEKQSCNWFKNRTNKWLCSLYVYFNRKWNKSELERIKELPLVRLENGEHVCVNDQLVYFPPKTDEDLEHIKPLLNDLRILKSTLLKKEGYNDIKAFLRDIGVEELNPENLITESICPLYSQPNKPLIRKNRRHVRYIFQSWQKTEESERSGLEESISEVPILRAYKGTQREISDFVVPCDAYLPQAYTGDNDLETYFSVSDGNFWLIDDKYLTNESDTKAWLQFLKAIGAMDTPRVIKRNIPVDYKECSKRSIQRAYITRTGEETIEDHSLYGLSAVLNAINEHRNVKLSQVLWSLLVKALPLAEQERETFFKSTYKGTYYSKYRSNSYIESDHFDAEFYCHLKSEPWIPDVWGKLRSPNGCFRLTSENQEILGNIVPYVHSDFDMNTRPAQWLAKKLDVRLEADADNVLNHLQTLSQKEASIEEVEPIYKFLESEDADLQRFEKERLIFTPEPESRWWRTDEVFWEDQKDVFRDDRGYLKAHYSEDLKSFFRTSLGIPKRADTLDYVRCIQDITSKAQAGNKEIRDRVQELYRCLWRSLQEEGNSLEDEEWEAEWKQVREGACWLGSKGDEWGFYLLEKLVWNDHNYCAEVVEGEVPFWEFGDDLLEFAKHLGVEGCYQASNIEFDCYSDQGECTIESEKVQKLVPYIKDFLNSTPWRGVYSQEKTAEILDRLSVRQAQKLEVIYNLKGKPVPDPRPRQSFLDPTSQGTILWLGLEESEGAYPDLIGDALQEYFGINELREFIKDLLLTTDPHGTTLLNWERRGFQADICLLPPGSDSKENENMLSESVDEKLLSETGSRDDLGTNDYEVETSTVHEESETENGNGDSTTDESVTSVYPSRPGSGGTRPRSGNRSSTPNRNRDTGYSGGGGGSGPSKKHEALKNYIVDNPSELGSGLKLVKKEHTFKLGGRVDILLEDNSGNPVTVEVKPYHIPPESNDEVWQAVRYKHVAAAEYGLRCDQVRSILVAPVIHNDVKTKCEKLGIEPFEVPQI